LAHFHGDPYCLKLTYAYDGRPTFAEILAKLDDIFVEMVLQEEVAQKLWQSLKDKVCSIALSLLYRARNVYWPTIRSHVRSITDGPSLSLLRIVVRIYRHPVQDDQRAGEARRRRLPIYEGPSECVPPTEAHPHSSTIN
jgi:hypothetical protein